MKSCSKVPLLGLVVATLMTLATATTGAESDHPAMKDPSKATETAPETFTAKFETTKGNVIFECTRDWAPHGVDRFYNLVKIGFFQDVALFRVKKGFVVQWGIHGNPEVSKHWRSANLPADPVKQSNTRGMLTYAMAGAPTTRSTQLFINYGNNANLDGMGFAPICKVTEGMDVAEKFYGEYGEKVTSKQGEIQTEGNAYLKREWPELDYILKTSITKEGKKADPGAEGKKDSSGAAPKTDEEKSDTSTYVIVALLAVGAFLAFMFMRNAKDDEEEEAPRPRKKTSTAKKSVATKKSAPAADPDTPVSSKKRKKKKKKTSR